MATLSSSVAAWAHGLSPADLPDEVVAAARRQVLDAMGNCVAASGYEFGGRLSGWVGTGAGTATAFGLPGGYPAEQSAMVNGVLAHGLDFDDTFQPGIVHIGAVVVPAALAVAEETGAGTGELLTAVVAGYELASRLGAAAPGGFHARGLHATPVCGAFAAALVAGKLRGLPPDVLADSLGIAGSFAAGLQQFLRDGSDTKRLHPGWAALAGLNATRFAQVGFAGPRQVWEGDFGLYATHVDPGRFDPAIVTAGLGERWNILAMSVKPYPCCHLMHAHIEAAHTLRAAGVRPADVVGVRAGIHEPGLRLLAEPVAEKKAPSTEYGAMFSLPYGVAVGLCDEHVGLASFTADRLQDPQVRRLAAATECYVDTGSAHPEHFDGEIEVLLSDGTRHFERVPVNPGSAARPLDDAALVAKFAGNLASAGLRAESAEQAGRELLEGGDAVGVAAKLNAELVRSPS